MDEKMEDIMAGFDSSLIAGFDYSLIEGMLRNNFNYSGKIDDLQREEDGLVVRLYNSEGLDVSIISKGYFGLKFLVVQDYASCRGERQVIEISDRSKSLSIIGYKVEDKDG